MGHIEQDAIPEAARERLREAMAHHGRGEIDAALALAEQALEIAPNFGEAHGYVGNTLVTRKRRFADGLAALSRASELLPHDPAVLFTEAWCREFVANALSLKKGGRKDAHQPVEEDAATLYAQAKEIFLRALRLDPEEGLRGDIEDMLDVIANVTGEPWEHELEAIEAERLQRAERGA